MSTRTEWTAFAARLEPELRRLGVSERDARFLGFGPDLPGDDWFGRLAALPADAGPVAFYAALGSDFAALQRDEAAWLAASEAAE